MPILIGLLAALLRAVVSRPVLTTVFYPRCLHLQLRLAFLLLLLFRGHTHP